MIKSVQLALFLLLTCLLSTTTNAYEIESGKILAEQLCAKCHSIDLKGKSPNKDAPAFRKFSPMWPLENLEEALAEGIVVGHDEMPEFKFSPEQISNFIAFLSSLNSKQDTQPK